MTKVFYEVGAEKFKSLFKARKESIKTGFPIVTEYEYVIERVKPDLKQLEKLKKYFEKKKRGII